MHVDVVCGGVSCDDSQSMYISVDTISCLLPTVCRACPPGWLLSQYIYCFIGQWQCEGGEWQREGGG